MADEPRAPLIPWRTASLAITVVAAVVGVTGLLHGRGASVGDDEAVPKQGGPLAIAYGNPAPFSRDPTVDQDAPLPGEESRRVLALYDSSEMVEDDDAPDNAPLKVPVSTENALAHKLAELPLVHLGLAVDYCDVDQEPLPSPERMARYRGLVSWFGDNRMRRPDAYLRWLLDQMHAGRRVVIVEGLGAYEDLSGSPASAALIDEVLATLGARWLGSESRDSSVITVADADKELTGFEAPLPNRLDYYARLHAEPKTRVYLRIALADEPGSASDVVWSSPAGGFALQTLVWREDRIADRWVTRWLIDPFRFFSAALGLDGLPRVDFTTLNGSRLFYSQIDGDGLDTITELDYASRCGEIIRDRIFKKYDLPFTASIVVGYTAPPPVGKGTPVDVEVARSILALPNVEIGSHGFAHPLNWRAKDGEVSVAGIPGYLMSGEYEVARSVEYIDRELAPPGKSCRIMLWTGDCNPSAKHLGVAYRLGLRNMNGGDPRMDPHYPSYAHLVPPVHRVGDYPQYYTSAANDYILTDEWKPPYYRFRNVLRTFERSGSPRRVVPVDVYFHYYSARNVTALTALEEIFDWVVRQPLAPVFASEYVDVVRDFDWARIARSGAERWTVRKGPSLRTVRFDDPTLHVDLARSRGVIGYLEEPSLGATYVHLDGTREAVIQLQHAPPPPTMAPYLERATHVADEVQLSTEKLQLTTRGPGRRTFVFANLPAGARYHSPSGEVIVDPRGRLTVTLPGGPGATRLELARAAP